MEIAGTDVVYRNTLGIDCLNSGGLDYREYAWARPHSAT